MTTRSKLGGAQTKVFENGSVNGAPTKKRSRQQSERDPSTVHAVTSRKHHRTANAMDGMVESDDGSHRNLVSAIFDIGMANSSPAVILENMIDRPVAITSERVKSKLQKFRNSKERAKKEFMDEYDAFLAKLHATVIPGGSGDQQGAISPAAIVQMLGCRKVVGGDAAALVTFVCTNEESMDAGSMDTVSGVPPQKIDEGRITSRWARKDARDYVEDFAGAGIPFPKLSEEERKTSLGLSLLHVRELFQSMRHHFMTTRAATTNKD
jgi:hypothetical protein